MTYVEKMAMENIGDVCTGGSNRLEKLINQIIADTKRACKNTYRIYHDFHTYNSGYVSAIDRVKIVEVKGEA